MYKRGVKTERRKRAKNEMKGEKRKVQTTESEGR